jgi:hypothetical protein
MMIRALHVSRLLAIPTTDSEKIELIYFRVRELCERPVGGLVCLGYQLLRIPLSNCVSKSNCIRADLRWIDTMECQHF